MIARTTFSMSALLAVCLFAFGSPGEVSALTYQWTDWDSSTIDANGFTAMGTITTTTTMVDVTYNNPAGVSFFQDGVAAGTDFFTDAFGARDEATSPFTSSVVDNIPPASEMIALNQAGNQTLTFSEAIANPVFAYVSLNGNGYAFDQDFEILSFGDITDGNNPGYWGAGTSFKNVVDLGGGVFEYQLLGTGEPHGTIRFLGVFDTLSWRSLTSENWNGFTIGIQGTAAEVPEPSAIAMLVIGASLLLGTRRQ